MSDAFADVAKMKNIKEAIKSHEGQLVESVSYTHLRAHET